MSELKPCPFCGAMPETDGKLVQCYLMPCDFRRFKMPVESWNTRPIEDALKARIAELEAAQRWIPVSERLPETYKPVLTVDMSEATQVPVPAFYNPDTECWSTHFKYDLWVTHWMPLPEPPNDTQTDTVVYGKDSKPLPCPFCGEIVKECNDVATPIDVALRKRIAELEGKIDQLTAHSDIERQDDKSSNDTQTQTIVYGKENSEVQE